MHEFFSAPNGEEIQKFVNDPVQKDLLKTRRVIVPFEALATFYDFLIEELEIARSFTPEEEAYDDIQGYIHEENPLAIMVEDIEDQFSKNGGMYSLELNQQRLDLLGEVMLNHLCKDNSSNNVKSVKAAIFYDHVADSFPLSEGLNIREHREALFSVAGVPSDLE